MSRPIPPATALLLLLAATLTAQQPPSAEPPPARAGAANDRFALELFARLRDQPGNLLFAPLSLRTALAMTATGARGRTAEQMAETLGLGDAGPAAVGELARALTGDSPGARLQVANALFGQRGAPFLPGFVASCERDFGAALSRVDFASDPERARAAINAWVAERTAGRIPSLLDADDVDPTTSLVLANTIEFDGTWRFRFDPERTAMRPFHRTAAEDGRVDVPTMSVAGTFRSFADELVRIVELPYAGGRLAMLVLLPRRPQGLAELEESLDLERLDGWLRRLQEDETRVFLPRFRSRGRFDLERTLPELGMVDAFVPGRADFSGIDGTRKLCIGGVVHEAVVAVDEEGTEAAGATAVVTKRGGPPEPPFRADQPFLYLIRDVERGTILFLGRLADPSERADGS